MCRILTHKLTKKRLLFIESNSLVSTLYVLDENDNKIISKNNNGRTLLNVKGETRYELAICNNKYLL